MNQPAQQQFQAEYEKALTQVRQTGIDYGREITDRIRHLVMTRMRITEAQYLIFRIVASAGGATQLIITPHGVGVMIDPNRPNFTCSCGHIHYSFCPHCGEARSMPR